MRLRSRWRYALLVAAVLLGAPLAFAQEVLDMSVDVLVFGSEPEAIVAAVAAAQEGATTVLVTRDSRLGGLFVLGELNVLDLKTQPFDYQLGLFDDWWRLVGREEAFDVVRAEAAFEYMLRINGVQRFVSVNEAAPLVEEVAGATRVSGLSFVDEVGRSWRVSSEQFIDASGDADMAFLAGAKFDLGWERFGVSQRMADTLVFHIGGVDWDALVAGVQQRGRSYAVAKSTVVWGHFGGYPAAYQPLDPTLRLRGLNLGRQEDGTVLVNALLIYGIDALDPESREQGRQRALAELPRIVDYLAADVPGLRNAYAAGAAEGLYVRETRHLRSRCDLSANDVLGNRVTAFDVAAGGYPLDAQTFTPHDSGFVYGVPQIYGGRLCMGIPDGGPEDLWVVGRSAGYDPVAFSSARVVPFGMAMAEAAGVAAAAAAASGNGSIWAALDVQAVHEIRIRLGIRGVYLPTVASRSAAGPTQHPNYAAFRTLISRGLSVMGYDNDPRLDGAVSAISFAYLLNNVVTRFHYRNDIGQVLVDAALSATPAPDANLDAVVAAIVMHEAVCWLFGCLAGAGWEGLHAAGLVPTAVAPAGALDRGDAYELAARLALFGAGE
ncbi:MAG: FAD-dependent oxidoreductase [Trueperaceae bacterium]|nr:FAD-dependent oxidoreductase [Trueperaceae bacterium]